MFSKSPERVTAVETRDHESSSSDEDIEDIYFTGERTPRKVRIKFLLNRREERKFLVHSLTSSGFWIVASQIDLFHEVSSGFWQTSVVTRFGYHTIGIKRAPKKLGSIHLDVAT